MTCFVLSLIMFQVGKYNELYKVFKTGLQFDLESKQSKLANKDLECQYKNKVEVKNQTDFIIFKFILKKNISQFAARISLNICPVYHAGLYFINILHTTFMHIDPKSIKIQSNCQYLFALLGSARAKTARRTLMKLTPGLYFINIFQADFSYKSVM
jgi:hypothetical protein